MSTVPENVRREWFTVNEAASALGVSRQSVQERVRKLEGAELVGGRWRIPGSTVEALLVAERAKAVASGTLVLLPGSGEAPDDVAREGTPGNALLLSRIAELERALGERDGRIEELHAERRRLRHALGAVMQGLSHLVTEEE